MMRLLLLASVMACRVRSSAAMDTPPEPMEWHSPSRSIVGPGRNPFELVSLLFTQTIFQDEGTYGGFSPLSAAFDFWILKRHRRTDADFLRHFDIPAGKVIEHYYKPPGLPDRSVRLYMEKQIFVSRTHKLLPDIKKTADEITLFEPMIVDFSKTSETRNVINNWAALVFSHPTKDFINTDSEPIALDYLIASVVYFECKWDTILDRSLTKNRLFHISRGPSIATPTMEINGWFRNGYIAGLDSDLVVLPLKDMKAEMHIFLPRDMNNIKPLKKGLPRITINQLRKATTRHMHIKLPRFVVEKTIDVGKMLRLLDPNYIPSTVGVLQKVYIEVTEEGVGFHTSRERSVPTRGQDNHRTVWSGKFEANHVFAFLIVTKDGRIVLSGIINKPSWYKKSY